MHDGPPLFPEGPVPTPDEFCEDYGPHFFDGTKEDVARSYVIEVDGEAIGHVNYDGMEERNDMIQGKDLRRYRIFMQLVDEELEVIAPFGKEGTYEVGTRLITEGEPAAYLYLIKSGKLQVKMTAASGQEIVLDEVSAGMSVGWSSLAERRISTASVDVVEPAELIAFESERMLRLFKDNCSIGYGVMRGLVMVVSRRLDMCRSRTAARH